MKKSLCILSILGLTAIALPSGSQAFWPPFLRGCPDLIHCDLILTHNLFNQNQPEQTEIRLGTLSVATCFSLKELGCRPWACASPHATTDETYWKEACGQHFPYDTSRHPALMHHRIKVSFPSF
jgi:hypothetical protein